MTQSLGPTVAAQVHRQISLAAAAALLIVGLLLACSGAPAMAATPSPNERQERYLVAGNNGDLPSREAIAAADGTRVDQIASIGVAVVRSSNPDFLTAVKQDRSVARASLDFDARI